MATGRPLGARPGAAAAAACSGGLGLQRGARPAAAGPGRERPLTPSPAPRPPAQDRSSLRHRLPASSSPTAPGWARAPAPQHGACTGPLGRVYL